MEYTIQKLAKLAGISTRTLRYYEEIGLLAPSGRLTSGYRIYGEKEVDALQQIMFYKELGLELERVKEAVHSPDFHQLEVLKQHLAALESKRTKINRLIETVNNTILKEEGKITMTDSEKFIGFQENLIRKNEKQYGAEIREKYGAGTVEESNAKIMNLTKEEYTAMEDLGKDLQTSLEKAVRENKEPVSDTGKQIMQMHKEWLQYTWPSYSAQAHHGLVEMYLTDERFQNHYDNSVKGCAKFLRDAVILHA